MYDKKFNSTQKSNYIKSLLFKKDLVTSLSDFLKNEDKKLSNIKIIESVLEDDLIVEKIKKINKVNDNVDVKIFVYSKIMDALITNKKESILKIFLKQLKEEDLKMLSIYEYDNNTFVAKNNKTFKKLCSKYKLQELKEENKQKDNVDEVKEVNSDNKTMKISHKMKRKKNINKKPIFITLILIAVIGISFLGYELYKYNKMIKEYDGLIFKGIYLGSRDISKTNLKDLDKVVEEEKNKILNGSIKLTNINEELIYTYENLGINIDDKKTLNEIKKYNSELSFFNKIKYIKNNGKNKEFNLSSTYKNDDIDKFIEELKNKVNKEVKQDGIKVDEKHNVYYDKGVNGFTLNVDKTKDKLTKALNKLNLEEKIELDGEVVINEAKNKNLESINTKISSYATTFLNSGNRGHNIVLATSRLNGTLLLPGEVFSYLKAVGPYSGANGYLPAPIYLNGEVSTGNGGGVCQLATTLYVAELKAGQTTTERYNHMFKPDYVPGGLDATVYSTTQDFKFKNNLKYPVYISAYVLGSYLHVDMWSNSEALEGIVYEPYSVYSNGGYIAYLKKSKDGKVLETKYLNKSFYKQH